MPFDIDNMPSADSDPALTSPAAESAPDTSAEAAPAPVEVESRDTSDDAKAELIAAAKEKAAGQARC